MSNGNKVDERVVEMRFDNKQFEAGVQTSSKSLENLKKGLQLDESARSLSNLDKTGRNFSLAGISAGVDALTSKFSTLSVIGITAIANITNSAINAGKSLIASLTVDPVKMGFDEYETKMNAIQTIMTNTASKGTTMDDVTKALNELNTYADQTIYDFAEMTRNIGTFTAAGVDLKTSVTSIKGIANLAAGSGSSALQASTAMYQLSQAIAAGSVKLQDWNSVVNAGMGGELFQKALEKTAKELGHGRNMAVSFRESLQDGWITTDVLTKTLQKFANDPSLLQAATQVKTFTQLIDTMKESVQSGWAQTWETIIGNKDEAAKLFTSINNVFSSIAGASANARNEMLAFWKANGGRDALIEGISNAFKGLQAVIKPIGEAFREIFPPMTGQKLVDITKAFRDLTANFKIGVDTSANIKASFKGLFAVVDMLGKGIKILGGVVGFLVKALIPGVGSLTSITAAIGNFLVRVNDSINANTILSTILEKMGIAFDVLKQIISDVLTAIGPTMDKLKTLLTNLGQSFMNLFAGTKVFAAGMTDTQSGFTNTQTRAEKLKAALDKIHAVFTKIATTIVVVAKAIRDFLAPIFDSIKKKFDSLSMGDIGSVLTGAGLLMFAKTLSKGLSSVDDILKNFSKILGEVGDTLKAFQLKIKAEALLKIAIALAILTAALIALSFIDFGKLAQGLGALTILFAELVIGLKMLDKSTSTIGLFQKQTKLQFVALGVAILLLAESAKILGSMDLGKLAQGVGALAAMMTMIGVFIKQTNEGDLKKSAGGLVGFSIGILILTASLAILGKMKPETLIQGALAIGTLMGVIALFVKETKDGDLKKSASGLVGFSIGIMILTGALAILGNMKEETLIQGALAIGSLMAVIMLFIKETKGGNLKEAAGGLLAFSIGILILTGSLAILGNLKEEKLIQGGVAIASLMAVISAFIKETKGGNLKEAAGGLMAFSIGILILTGSLAVLASLNPDRLLQGGLAISTLMMVISTFIKETKGGNLKASASGLMAFSVGIMILSASVAVLSLINKDKIIQGVVAIVALMTAIGAFIKLTNGGDLEKSSKGLMGFAVGLMILAGVIAILSALNVDKLMVASVALTTLMVVIGLFVKLTNGADLNATAIGLIGISVAIAIMAASLVAVGKLDFKNIIAASGAISVLLLVIIAFSTMTNGVDLVLTAAGLVVFAGALVIMSKVLTTLGQLEIKSLLKGLGALAAVLLILGLTAAILSPFGPMVLVVSGAMLVMAAALNVLTPCLVALGKMSLPEIGKAILMLAGVFLVLGLAGLILAPVSPIITILAADIALLGTGCLAAGTGILAFSKGLDILAVSGDKGGAVLVTIFTNIIKLIPLALQQLAEGIVAFAKTIGEGTPIIVTAVINIMNGILDSIIQTTPKIVEAFTTMVISAAEGLAKSIPIVADCGMKMATGVLQGIANNMPQFVSAGIDIGINFINGLASKVKDVADAGFNFVISFINGIADSIRENHDNLYAAIKNLFDAVMEAIRDLMPNFKDVGGNIVQGMIDGIVGKKVDLKKTLSNMIADNIGLAQSLLGIHSPSKVFAQIGSYTIQGMINGIESMDSYLSNSTTSVVSGAVDSVRNFLGIHSPSKVFAEIGRYSVMGFANGLDKFSWLASDGANKIGSTTMDSLRNAVANIADIVNGNIDVNPTIRPVLDLGAIATGASAINSILNGNQGLTVENTSNKAAAISRSRQQDAVDNQNGSTGNGLPDGGSNKPATPLMLQLVLENGSVLAEYLVNDLDNLTGAKTKLSGRTVGV